MLCWLEINNHLVPVLFKPLSHLHSCSFYWNVFLLLVNFFENKFMLIFGCRLQCIEASCLTAPLCTVACYRVYVCCRISLWLRHTWKSIYIHTHPIIENALVQHKMAKNLRITLCCQNQVSKGTNQRYELHVSANISVDSARLTEGYMYMDTCHY